VPVERFAQEPHYTTALIAVLQGTAYSGPLGRVEFISTAANDRGSGSAESWSGVDFAITAQVSDGITTIDKVIFFQAKSAGRFDTVKLDEQIRSMKKFTRAPKVIEVPSVRRRIPEPVVYSGNRFLLRSVRSRMMLSDYIVARVLTTLDGDTRPKVVTAAQSSSLEQLKIIAQMQS